MSIPRLDGWMSALSGYGTSKDKRTSVVPQFGGMLAHRHIETLWRTNDIAARIIETIPGEALRQGVTFAMDDKQVVEKVTTRMSDLGVIAKLMEAASVERGYGGSVIYPVMNDLNAELSEPLNENGIANISHLIVLEPSECQPTSWYDEFTDPKFGKPRTYRVSPYVQGGNAPTTVIHESRLIPFHGQMVSRRQQSLDSGFGDSVLMKVYDVLRDYGISWDATAVLLHEFSQASMKIKGLAELMAKDNDSVVKNRIKTVALARSTINAVLMDADGEEFERKQTPVAGLAELLAAFATRLAAAADMPVTLLMGQSPAGLNATGESDVRFFYDRVAVWREKRMRAQLERLIQLILLDKSGPTSGNEPADWTVSFNPLWQPSEKEVADTRKVVADTDKVYYEMGLSAEEILVSRFGADEWSMETVLEDPTMESTDDDEVTDEEVGDIRETSEAPEPEGQDIQKTVLNGSQIASLITIVGQVNEGLLTRAQAEQIIMLAFQVDAKTATDLLGPEGDAPAPLAQPELEPNEEDVDGAVDEEEASDDDSDSTADSSGDDVVGDATGEEVVEDDEDAVGADEEE